MSDEATNGRWGERVTAVALALVLVSCAPNAIRGAAAHADAKSRAEARAERTARARAMREWDKRRADPGAEPPARSEIVPPPAPVDPPQPAAEPIDPPALPEPPSPPESTVIEELPADLPEELERVLRAGDDVDAAPDGDDPPSVDEGDEVLDDDA